MSILTDNPPDSSGENDKITPEDRAAWEAAFEEVRATNSMTDDEIRQMSGTGMREETREEIAARYAADEAEDKKIYAELGGKVAGPDGFEPFPLHLLPELPRLFIEGVAGSIGCDQCFVAVPFLVSAATAIGNSTCIQLKRGWQERCIIWAAIVTKSGGGKSPSADAATQPLRKRQTAEFVKHEARKREHDLQVIEHEKNLKSWQAAKSNTAPPESPTEPTATRYITDDSTMEAQVMLLQQNPRGIGQFPDELSAMLGRLNQYLAKGAGGDMARMLEMHRGGPVTVDRKGGTGPIHVPHASVNLFGGIQPGILSKIITSEHRENGFLARLLFAYPPGRALRWTEEELDPLIESETDRLFDRLFALDFVVDSTGQQSPRVLTLQPDARAAFIEFVNAHADEQDSMADDEGAAWSKLKGYAARLALVIHCLRVASLDPTITDANTIDSSSIASGVGLAKWFGAEALRVYAMLGESESEREQRKLIDLIRRIPGQSISARDLAKRSRAHKAPGVAEQALEDLIKGGFGSWEDAPPGFNGGRPTVRFKLGVGETSKNAPKTGFGYADNHGDKEKWGVVA